MPSGLLRYLAFGTGVGIEIGPVDLQISIARVRPSTITGLGVLTIENFRQRPAAEWGREYSEFLKKYGLAHLSATVLLPRHEVIVRLVTLPGVEDKDLTAAINYQLDNLHPYAEDDAVAAHGRLGKSPDILVGVVRRQILDSYTGLFAEAGIKVTNFTFSAATFYAAVRLNTEAPKNFFALANTMSGFEVYGESAAKRAFSAFWDLPEEKVASMAIAELRIDQETIPLALFPTASMSAATTSACPMLSLAVNLLPEEQRKNTSALRYVPTIVLLAALGLLLTAIVMHQPYDTNQYVKQLKMELAKVEKGAQSISASDKEIEAVRARTMQLDDYRKRTKNDLDVLLNLTSTLAPPAYLNYYEINRDTVQLAGEIEQASTMLRLLDATPYLKNSEFTLAIARMTNGDAFRTRSQRKTPPPPPVAVATAMPAAAPNNVAPPPPVANPQGMLPFPPPGARR